MRTRLTLQPGKRVTKQLLRMCGERLVCVRYDEDGKRRLKTVELVVDEKPWTPKPRKTEPGIHRVVGISVAFEEKGLRNKVKKAGGRWSPARRSW